MHHNERIIKKDKAIKGKASVYMIVFHYKKSDGKGIKLLQCIDQHPWDAEEFYRSFLDCFEKEDLFDGAEEYDIVTIEIYDQHLQKTSEHTVTREF